VQRQAVDDVVDAVELGRRRVGQSQRVDRFAAHQPTACNELNTRTAPVEPHRPVVTNLQFPIQVCFPCNDHAQPAADKAPTSVTDTLVLLIVVKTMQNVH